MGRLTQKDKRDLIRLIRILREVRRMRWSFVELSELSIETGIPDRRIAHLVKKHTDLLGRKVGISIGYQKSEYYPSGERPVFGPASTSASYFPAGVTLGD